MKKIALIALAALMSHQAFASSYLDDRGYRECERQLTEEFSDAGVMFKRQYMVKRSDQDRTFYINKTVWADGERTPVASTCVTSINGRNILTMESDFRQSVTVEDLVAAN